MKTIYNEQYFSSQEISKELSVSDITIRHYFRSGLIKGVKIGNVWHCKKVDVINFLNPIKTERTQNNNESVITDNIDQTTQTIDIETIEIPFENSKEVTKKVTNKKPIAKKKTDQTNNNKK